MKFLSLFQVVADVLILALVLFYFFKRKEDRKRDKIMEDRAKEMLLLNKSMDTLIKEAQKVTESLMNALDSKQSGVKEILDGLEAKKEEVLKLLAEPIMLKEPPEEELIEIDDELDEQVELDEPDEKKEEVEDKYAEAARLAEEGYSPDEIASQVNLSRGEVELILDLKK